MECGNARSSGFCATLYIAEQMSPISSTTMPSERDCALPCSARARERAKQCVRAYERASERASARPPAGRLTVAADARHRAEAVDEDHAKECARHAQHLEQRGFLDAQRDRERHREDGHGRLPG